MDRIGRYRIVGEMGRGAMGVVYRATDPAIGRDVAIKTVHLETAGEAREKLKERLFREARSAGVLSHPNIVTIYDMGEAAGLAYVAMGLVKGPSLQDLMSQQAPIPGSRVLSILRQTAAALDYAHSRGVVHRDIKPGNIMTDEDGAVKITDFGIARFAAAERLSDTKTITGTPNYMSPEQIQGLDTDGRTDQFSLGVVAWEMLTGERPFAGDNLSTVVYRIVSEDPLPAPRLNGTLTPRIDEVLQRVLAKDPANRFANCSTFVGALEMACAESPGWQTMAIGEAAEMPTVATEWIQPAVVAKASPSDPVVPPTPKHRIWPWAAGVVILAGLGALAFWPQPAPQLSTEPAAAAPQPLAQEATPPSVEIPPPVVPTDPVPAEGPVPEPPAVGKLQDIHLATVPPGSKAVLDGNAGLSCDTPCVLHARPGVHHVTLTLDGYRSQYKEFRVETTGVDLTGQTMQQIMGTVMVSSTPPGARITVNGAPMGNPTPTALSLKPGNYVISLMKDGRRHTETVRVGENTVYLKVTLEQ